MSNEIVYYSQFEDEPIILGLLRKFRGPVHKRCCELGAWDGLWLSNTAYFVRHLGWRGTFVEADPEKADECRRNYQDYPAEVIHARVGVDNVNDLVPPDLDLLSIDIDSNDYWVFKALTSRPRIVILEYNPRRTGLDVYPHDPDLVKTDANLKHIQATAASTILLAEEKGYRLAGADCECNLFFVPEELYKGSRNLVRPRPTGKASQ